MNKSVISLIKTCALRLEPLYQDQAYQEQIVWWMLVAISGKSQVQLLVLDKLAIKYSETLESWIEKHVQDKMPLQYLIGSVPFADCTILVESPILIPRPETEEWICNLIAHLKQVSNKNIRILDLCTGSGALAIALAHALPEATLIATDISERALDLARRNALFNNISTITFIQSDLFQALAGEKFDLIVSNPPYLSHEEWEAVDPAVRIWEDYYALVAPGNGLQLITTLIAQAPGYLRVPHLLGSTEIPQLFIEIGYKQGEVVQNFMKQFFVKTAILKDYAHCDRVVTGIL